MAGIELTMLDMSVAQNSVASSDSTILQGNKSAEILAVKSKPKKIVEFSKLRGKQRTAAIAQLNKIVDELPSLEEQQSLALQRLIEKEKAVTSILEILNEDADKLPLNVLGDFHVLASNPVPFLECLQEAVKENEMRSPERQRNKKQKENFESKLKTSTSLNRVVAKTSISSSSMKPTTQKPGRPPSKAKAQATPLNNRALRKNAK